MATTSTGSSPSECSPMILSPPRPRESSAPSRSTAPNNSSPSEKSNMTSNGAIGWPRKEVYHWQEFTENLERYCPGGYHPTHLGDIFHGRYRVIHKLGWGSYSVVWLARDLEVQRNVALKIIIAEQSETSTEATTLRALHAGDENHPGFPFICHLLDEFCFDGPNGRHRCLVLRATGCSVADSQDESNKFPIHVARSISVQALLGLSYIHSCGVVHGDLHRGNLLFQRPELEHWTEEEVFENLGEPETEPVERLDKKPHGKEAPDYSVTLAIVGMRSKELAESTRITISDFGQSFFAADNHDSLQTPRRYAPPEHFFKDHLGPAVDVWTVGLSIYTILSAHSLFEAFYPNPDVIIAEMVDTLGHPPDRWWNSWEKKHEFFAADGSLVKGSPRPLAVRLKRAGDTIGNNEQKSLEQLLRGRRSEQGGYVSGGMLEYEPSRRMTANDAIMSDWVTRWAMPAFERAVTSQRDKVPRSAQNSDPLVASKSTVE